MFQAQHRETKNSTCKAAVSSKIIMTTSVTTCKTKTKTTVCKTKTRACKTKTKTDFFAQTGLVLRPTVSDHITGFDWGFADHEAEWMK